jgi:molybdopterin synthase catalytic subunit
MMVRMSQQWSWNIIRDDGKAQPNHRCAGERALALLDTLVIHRVGALMPADQIVLVVTASKHRGEALRLRFIMDYLKTQAPFWKKSRHLEGAPVDAQKPMIRR